MSEIEELKEQIKRKAAIDAEIHQRLKEQLEYNNKLCMQLEAHIQELEKEIKNKKR